MRILVGLAVAGAIALSPSPGHVDSRSGTDTDSRPKSVHPMLRSRIASLERRTAPGRPDRQIVIGHSALGRPIRLTGYGYGQDRTRILVVGCIHGTECAASGIRIRHGPGGCPPPAAIFVVPNLNPDGFAEGTRLNGRGVDLNRNFSSGWEPMYSRGDPEYSGPHPFSEPETRLAARLTRALHPDITIWFHQETEPMVRAWGPSVPAARWYAHLVDQFAPRSDEIPFERLHWLAGTAPNWQNHHFPGTSSFVVELPPGPLDAEQESRVAAATAGLGSWWDLHHRRGRNTGRSRDRR